MWCLNLHKNCENNAILKENYTVTLLIAFKMVYPCCFRSGGILDFLQKSFITIDSKCNFLTQPIGALLLLSSFLLKCKFLIFVILIAAFFRFKTVQFEFKRKINPDHFTQRKLREFSLLHRCYLRLTLKHPTNFTKT